MKRSTLYRYVRRGDLKTYRRANDPLIAAEAIDAVLDSTDASPTWRRIAEGIRARLGPALSA